MLSKYQPNRAAKDLANRRIPDALDDAIREVVYESEAPAKALATAVGVRVGYLYDAANPDGDTQFQARLIAPLTNASGNDQLIRFLAHACGGVFVRLATPGAKAADEPTSRVLIEVGNYLHAVAESQADGVITESEARRTRRAVEEAIAALLAHVFAIEARAVPDTEARS